MKWTGHYEMHYESFWILESQAVCIQQQQQQQWIEWIHLKVVYKWAADMNYTEMQIN